VDARDPVGYGSAMAWTPADRSAMAAPGFPSQAGKQSYNAAISRQDRGAIPGGDSGIGDGDFRWTASPVPKKLQKQAKMVFAQGKSYFVWSEQEVPIKSRGSQTFVRFPLKYSLNPATKAQPFAVFVVIRVNSGGRTAEFSNGIDGHTKHANGKEEWQATGTLILLGDSLYGKGEAKVFLVQRDEFRKSRADKTLPIPEPISNIVTLPIILE